MKSNHTLKEILLLIMLVGAGLVSPSNGVDDKVDKLPLQILSETAIIILVSVSLYLLYRRWLEKITPKETIETMRKVIDH